MKQFHKWRSLFGAAALIWIVLEAISIINGYYFSAGFLLLLVLVFGIPFLGSRLKWIFPVFWEKMPRKPYRLAV